MRIVAVKGFSNTGKTTTVTELVKELRRRGYTVGTIKDIHYEGYRADTPGTDTFRHMESGARRVTALGLRETAVIAGRRMRIEDVLKYYKEDFVIIEGDCGLMCPAVITGRTAEDVDRRMCEEAVAVSGVISEAMEEYRGLPVINGRKEVERLADIVERATEKQEEKREVQLTIDGREIPMVPFVKKTLENVVTGAVKALDGYEEGKEIVIRIK
ncbi:MAG TPA: molybdopterin-guanine dinucleotide biosynthesis protein B [Candidatus Copromorpha excrementigallinarum]|uniref:Molybdopterin-guanine dinucleotide biosynthesis protein B n=1 Tax=Candidatus Allocopromorpha excrementigallinarum TaxID=2840742 RepID=A0A9D1I1I9_9FIRM|nr:molybdopterin-guanine dinucleotide biosynthesis protein B [Candidatus Copromorpha excrementigallinarum]